MRTLHALPEDRARAVASETLGVWCSLAERLGVWAVKSELEDLCFVVLQVCWYRPRLQVPAESLRAQPQTFLGMKLQLDRVWAGSAGSDAALASTAAAQDEGEAALLARLLAEAPRSPGDDALSPQQLRTRALLAAVLPFDLLTCTVAPGALEIACERAARQRASGMTPSRVPSPLPHAARQPGTTGSRAPASATVALQSLANCQRSLRDELRLSAAASGLEVTVQGRLKSVYSTYRKAMRKQCALEEIYDARALRVVIEDVAGQNTALELETCYSLLQTVHRLWKPVPGEVDDYISRPKKSGYQSLHTAVRCPDGALEIQIRTRRSHEDAEYGAAAHWTYKDSPAPVASVPSDPTRASLPSSPRRRIDVGAPLLRIAGGRISDAVAVSVDAGGTRILVAVQFGVRLGAGGPTGRARAADYEALTAHVEAKGWFMPGQGDLRTCLEQYVLCSDGRWHMMDAVREPVPAVQPALSLTNARPLIVRSQDGSVR